jgi:iron complex transport system substrate-binding protein
MRAIFEAMGAEILWDGTLQKVTGTLEDHEVILIIGETKAYSNGKPVDLDSPGIIVNRRTMVPIRFIAESLEAEVDWDGKTNTVIITK